MIAQVEVRALADAAAAAERVRHHAPELLALADEAVPGLVARGGGAREIEARVLADDVIVVHVLVDCQDAMGANLVNAVAEASPTASPPSPAAASAFASSRTSATSAAFA